MTKEHEALQSQVANTPGAAAIATSPAKQEVKPVNQDVEVPLDWVLSLREWQEQYDVFSDVFSENQRLLSQIVFHKIDPKFAPDPRVPATTVARPILKLEPINLIEFDRNIFEIIIEFDFKIVSILHFWNN